MEILSYLAYETVAQVTGCFIYQFTIAIRAETDGFLVTSAHTVFLFQIVDLSLLVKQEMTAKTNPISHLISASYIQYNTHAEVRIFTSITLIHKHC